MGVRVGVVMLGRGGGDVSSDRRGRGSWYGIRSLDFRIGLFWF